MSSSIYLDFNATTPLAPSVREAITKSLEEDWANPSSSSAMSMKANKVIDEARVEVANMISADPKDIVFTSGGTESNNMAIQSVVRWARSVGVSKPHVILSNVEHVATLLPIKQLAADGVIDYTEVAVDKQGLLHAKDVMEHVRPNTCMLTIMMANNETGVLFPIKEISRHVHKVNSERQKAGLTTVWLHTDAAQAVGKVEVNVKDLKVDYLTIVGHKFYGPRIGALYCRNPGHTPLYPVIQGGGQERGYRPGTENTPMIVGLGRAAHLVTDSLESYGKHMLKMRNYLEAMLLERNRPLWLKCIRVGPPEAKNKNVVETLAIKFGGIGVVINCLSSQRLPNTVSVSFANVKMSGEQILGHCSHLIASTTAACHSHDKVSGVLLKSGVTEELARSAIRLSVGRDTSMEEIDIVVKDLQSSLSCH